MDDAVKAYERAHRLTQERSVAGTRRALSSAAADRSRRRPHSFSNRRWRWKPANPSSGPKVRRVCAARDDRAWRSRWHLKDLHPPPQNRANVDARIAALVARGESGTNASPVWDERERGGAMPAVTGHCTHSAFKITFETETFPAIRCRSMRAASGGKRLTSAMPSVPRYNGPPWIP